jgi:alpha-tubulin suppressor-like RCC1 family protein
VRSFTASPVIGVKRTLFAAGSFHNLVVKSDGTVWAWGDNYRGQLGGGTAFREVESRPVQVSNLTDVVSVAAGHAHSLALKSDGTLWVWGGNEHGELGDGTTVQRNTPVRVSSLAGVVAVAAGSWYSLAVKSDGTVWSWGNNTYGQLGDGTTTDRLTPVQVPNLTGVVAVAAGDSHSLALKSDGTLWAWGYNNGRLGDGTRSPYMRSTPVRVSSLAGVVAVAAGTYHSLAVKSDGTLWSWGDNIFGQLGDGSTAYSSMTPVQVPSLTGVVAVSAGHQHSLAVKSDGTFWAWGRNENGQLGDGTTVEQRTTPVNLLGGVVAVAAGSYHSLAVKSDGTLWAWGNNVRGQLGDGTGTSRSTPGQVIGLSMKR